MEILKVIFNGVELEGVGLVEVKLKQAPTGDRNIGKKEWASRHKEYYVTLHLPAKAFDKLEQMAEECQKGSKSILNLINFEMLVTYKPPSQTDVLYDVFEKCVFLSAEKQYAKNPHSPSYKCEARALTAQLRKTL